MHDLLTVYAWYRLGHVQVFLKLLSIDHVLDIVDECCSFIEAKVRSASHHRHTATLVPTLMISVSAHQIEDVLRLCIPALGTAIPPFRFPRFMYRTEGCFGFFEGKFKHVLDSEELEAHVFHCLREIGNGLAFLLLLSDAMVSLCAHGLCACGSELTSRVFVPL